MLVLTRKLMEKLYIGSDVCITIVRVEGGQVRLGIEAPRSISVLRAELIEPAATSIGLADDSMAIPQALTNRVKAPAISALETDIPRLGPSR